MNRAALSVPIKNCLGKGLAGVMLAMSSSALGQALGQGNDTDMPIWRILSALALCIALALMGAWAIKTKLEGRVSFPAILKLPKVVNPERRLVLHETLRLTHQANLNIVSCDGRELLIVTSGSDVRLLETLPALKSTVTNAPSDML